MQITFGPALGIAVAALVVAAVLVTRLGMLGHSRAVLTAAARATLQLAAVSLVIGAVIASLPLALLFLGMMTAVAGRTAGHRICPGPRWVWAMLPVLGTVPFLAGLAGTGVVPLRGIALIPIGGILVGGAMTATTLAGRRALDELRAGRGEFEAALALGFLPREAALLVCRERAADALIPALDQTRSVGLVTLPGAFVGMLLGGASPVQAGAVQLLVLVGLLAVEALAILITVELVAAGRFDPAAV
ncbi:MAG TPA: ABC transporter permease [Pseudonocardiaceae bacterium]|nr:ABC transporter permease [Pseudonocardiaceae bacterium]